MLFRNKAYVVSSFLKLHDFVYLISWSNKFNAILFFFPLFLYFNDILRWQPSATLKTASVNP